MTAKAVSPRCTIRSPRRAICHGRAENTAEEAIANAYDMVINGYEVSRALSVSTVTKCSRRSWSSGDHAEQRHKFGFLLDAFQYGTPPHASLALVFAVW
ncbi:amino acid--tRNA ligase-related protein [Shigella flexneri]